MGYPLTGVPLLFGAPMELELGLTPYDIASQHCLAIDPERHRILTPLKPGELPVWPWLRKCQQWAPQTRLAVYFHLETGNYVLGNWTYAPWEATVPLMQELETFSGEPTLLWPDGLLCPEIMEHRLAPVHDQKEKVERRIREKEAAEAQQRQDDLQHRGEVVKYMKKKGLDEAAHKLNTGRTPFVGRGRSPDGNAAMIDELKTLTRLAAK